MPRVRAGGLRARVATQGPAFQPAAFQANAFQTKPILTVHADGKTWAALTWPTTAWRHGRASSRYGPAPHLDREVEQTGSSRPGRPSPAASVRDACGAGAPRGARHQVGALVVGIHRGTAS